jgi:hypothetical protein
MVSGLFLPYLGIVGFNLAEASALRHKPVSKKQQLLNSKVSLAYKLV